jgi:NAD(P)-dependent dehydrogenase (short-subunit alcohol dehydrogenase family)
MKKEVAVLFGAGAIGTGYRAQGSNRKAHGATINSISPGIIITPLANDELHGICKAGYLDMIQVSPAGRAGTPDEVGDLAEFLMSSRGRFISGTDILIDGGTTVSYWYGDLQYLKTTH